MTTLAVATATIAAGQSLSSPADCSAGTRVCRLIMPDDWSGGAPLTFQLSVDGVNWHNLMHVDPVKFNSYEVALPRIAINGVVTLPPGLGGDVSYVKVRSGTATLPILQEFDREFQLVMEIPNSAAE
jgi:hypothetical protein